MSRPGWLPSVTNAVGTAGTGPSLARLVDLTTLAGFLLGPVTADPPSATDAPGVVEPEAGGVRHTDAVPLRAEHVACTDLPWLAARRVPVLLAVRAGTGGEAAATVARLRASPGFGWVCGIEVDLRGADEQRCLRTMARVREQAPRDLALHARLSATQADLVGAARSAVGGGASALVVAGSVPLLPGWWLSGPATAPVCLAGLSILAQAQAAGRVPAVPLVASGGVTDAATAARARAAGAASLQVGTATWVDPTLLGTLRHTKEHA